MIEHTGSIGVGNEVDDFISDIEREHVIVLWNQLNFRRGSGK